jgi:hypothetical protein
MLMVAPRNAALELLLHPNLSMAGLEPTIQGNKRLNNCQFAENFNRRTHAAL